MKFLQLLNSPKVKFFCNFCYCSFGITLFLEFSDMWTTTVFMAVVFTITVALVIAGAIYAMWK